MPNVIRNELKKCKHPNSRKTISLTKKVRKMEKRDQIRLGNQIKQNVVGEKIFWFKERLPDDPVLSKEQILQLIEQYIARHDQELEQIELKHSIGRRVNHSRQHSSREDIIKISKGHEEEEFKTCGIELPNFVDPQQMDLLRSWNGELRFLQNFKLCRFARNQLS